MQPQGHVQVFTTMVDSGLDPQAALDLPRFCIEDGTAGGAVALEEGISDEAIADLAERGHQVKKVAGWERALFGRGQIIVRDPESGVLIGGSDPRVRWLCSRSDIGVRQMKLKHFIDSNKGITFLVLLGMIIYYRQWNNPTAMIYLALHGTYGLMWVMKSRIFPDKQWEQRPSLWFGLLDLVCVGFVLASGLAHFLALASSAGMVIDSMRQHLYIGRVLPLRQRHAKIHIA